MIPIYEQGSGRGIGHSLQSFLERFDDIWEQHIKLGRAKALAFVLYDFNDQAIRHILEDHGVFAKLDRLSGTSLSIFYLHAGTAHSIEIFNRQFLSALGASEATKLPCVVFFRFNSGQVQEIEIAQLESADLIHGFGELYGAVSAYVASVSATTSGKQNTALRWLKSGSGFVGIEAFRALMRKALEFVL